MWVQSLGWEDLPKQEMATHSSVLAWKIPQTEEPVRGYSSWGYRKSHTTVHAYAQTVMSEERAELRVAGRAGSCQRRVLGSRSWPDSELATPADFARGQRAVLELPELQEQPLLQKYLQCAAWCPKQQRQHQPQRQLWGPVQQLHPLVFVSACVPRPRGRYLGFPVFNGWVRPEIEAGQMQRMAPHFPLWLKEVTGAAFGY